MYVPKVTDASGSLQQTGDLVSTDCATKSLKICTDSAENMSKMKHVVPNMLKVAS